MTEAIQCELVQRQLDLLSAICCGSVKVGQIILYEGIVIIHINEKRFECPLDDKGLPVVVAGLADAIGRCVAAKSGRQG